MDPNQQPNNQSQQFYPSSSAGPQPNAPVVSQPVLPLKTKRSNNNKLIIIIVAGAVLLLLIIVTIVALSSSKKPAVVEQQQTADDADIQPATSIGIEAINNGISQDIGSLNDSEDFPANKLDDKSLNL